MHTSPNRYLLYGGARGGGKSYGLLFEALITAWEVPKSTVLVLRKTFPMLEATFLSDLRKIDPAFYGGDPQAFNRGRSILTLPNGSQIIFRSCTNTADVDQFRGGQFLLIVIDEANQFTFEVFEALQASVRSPFRTTVSGQMVKPRMLLGSNPGGIGASWLKALFIDKQPLSWMHVGQYDPSDYGFIPAYLQDNPHLASDPSYLKMLNSLSPVLRAQWLEGRWDTLSGVFFECFDPTRTVISADKALRLLDTQQFHPRWTALDWGYVHLAPFLAAARVEMYSDTGEKSDHVLIYSEHSVRGISDAAIGSEFLSWSDGQRFEKIYASPEIFGDDKTRNSRAKVISDVLVRGHQPRLVRADNDRVGGWSLIRNMLMSGTEEHSRLLISDDCNQLIEALPQLMCDGKRPEDVKKTTLDSDDWGDCCRYLLKSYLQPGKKSNDDLVHDAIKPLIEAGDHTAAHFVADRMKAAAKAAFGPLFKRRRH